MNKYNMDGTEKTGEQPYCRSCKNGKVFLETPEELIKTQKYQNNLKEPICGVCNSKYKIPLKKADKLINGDCDKCVWTGGNFCTNNDPFFLCIGNEHKFVKQIRKEVEEVSIDYLNARKEFEETGVCPHLWIDSRPFRTGIGTHTIESCRVCNLARTTINGKKYEDNIAKIVGFLADKGIQAEKIRTQQVNLFDNIIPTEPKTFETNIFEPISEELGFVDYEPKLNFV